jgi:hypothetical protein
MELALEYAACGVTSHPERRTINDGSTTVPVLLGQIAQLEEEAAYLRTMLCELLRKNEKLREQARTAFGELQMLTSVDAGVKPGMWA